MDAKTGSGGVLAVTRYMTERWRLTSNLPRRIVHRTVALWGDVVLPMLAPPSGIAAALLAVLLFGCTNAARYRRCHSETALRAILERDILPGTSYGEVTRLLGSGTPFSLQLYRRLEEVNRKNPGLLPDGFVDTDVLVIYTTDTMADYSLHFRDDKLINHPLGEGRPRGVRGQKHGRLEQGLDDLSGSP